MDIDQVDKERVANIIAQALQKQNGDGDRSDGHPDSRPGSQAELNSRPNSVHEAPALPSRQIR